MVRHVNRIRLEYVVGKKQQQPHEKMADSDTAQNTCSPSVSKNGHCSAHKHAHTTQF